MTHVTEIQAESRTNFGKGHSRRMRRLANTIPGVIYGAGQETAHITMQHNTMLHAMEDEGFFSRILTMNIAGEKQKVVVKAVQRHEYKPKLVHIDFQRVSATEKLTMNVPLHFLGEEECPGIKEGGVASHLMTDIEIQCLPDNLPEFIEVDISQLNMGDTLHLTDIKLPEGVEIMAFVHGTDEENEEHNTAIVNVHKPIIIEEPEVEEEAAESEEGAEGEAAAEGEGAKEEGKEDAKPEGESKGDEAKE